VSGAGKASGPPDLRLAGLAVATWLSALGALHASLAAAIWVAGLAAGLAAAMGWWGWRSTRTRRRSPGRLPPAGVRPPFSNSRWTLGMSGTRPPGRHSDPAVPGAVGQTGRRLPAGSAWVVTGVLLGVVCGSAATAARLANRDAPALADLTRERAAVRAELVVRDDPRRIGGVAGRPPSYLVAANLTRIRTGSAPVRTIRLSVSVLLLASDPAWLHLLPGQRVAATGRLGESHGGDLTAAVLSATGGPEWLGRAPWEQRAAGALRAGLQRACEPLPDAAGGLLPGLIVGDTSRLEPAVNNDFRTTGMTHLTAVSGSNVAIILGAVLMLARLARAGPRVAAVACALALVGFVILVRPSPSVLRAAAMGALAMIALAAGRPRAALPALCATITVLVVVDPAQAGNPGFALSVLATGGLLLIAPQWRDGLRRRGVPAGFAEALAVPAAAQVACGPVIAGLSGTVSIVAIPANLLAVPAIAPATVLGVLAAIVSPIWPAGAEFAAWLGSWPAWWLVTIARYGAGVPAGVLPWPGGAPGGLLLAGLTVAALLAARRRLARRVLAVVAVAAVLGALPVRLVASGWPPPGWVMVACAVGQGDAAVLPAGAGHAVVIDAGPEPAATDRCLRRLGVHTVSLLVISHFHADHVGGVAGVFQGRKVDAVVTTGWTEPAAGREAVLRAAGAAGTPVRAAEVGWVYAASDVNLTVVGPPHRLAGTRSDPNNNSLVLKARVRGVDILLAGDAEQEEQHAMLDGSGAAAMRVQILKVAHHGSSYQDPEFLAAVDPLVALVSVGTGNPYGHPNLSVLARLARQGARVLRTDTSGDLAAVRTAPGGLAVAVRGFDPGRRAGAQQAPSRGPPTNGGAAPA
jgi:competence protein ComEC